MHVGIIVLGRKPAAGEKFFLGMVIGDGHR